MGKWWSKPKRPKSGHPGENKIIKQETPVQILDGKAIILIGVVIFVAICSYKFTSNR